MDGQRLLESIYDQVIHEDNSGELADYIPELGKVDPNKLGVFLRTVDSRECFVGDYAEKFSIQSISKVISLVLAYDRVGGKLWERVDVEPAGTAFNSLVQLEFEEGIPRNPFINSGAIVVCDELVSIYDDPEKVILDFIHEVTGDPGLGFNTVVAESERNAGYRNIALVNFLKSFDNLKNDAERVLDFYFKLSSLEMSCKDLVGMFMFLCNEGVNPRNGKQILSHSGTNRINAIMSTCGFYDEAGEFAYRVGLPGKSGVGGGIVALLPGEYTVAVWSPKLNPKGNSYRGMRFLELLTTATQATIF
jgi:glutaminase